jgi:hypothetical protein
MWINVGMKKSDISASTSDGVSSTDTYVYFFQVY